MALMSTDCNGFKMQCVAYISGYVLHMMTRFIKCDTCRKACLAQYSQRHPTALQLFDYKQRGPLVTPSKDVTMICSETENVITFLITKKTPIALMNDPSINERVVTMVMRRLQHIKMFEVLKDHQLESASAVSMFDDHLLKLMRTIILCYTKIKLFHCIRLINDNNSQRVRQKLSRISIFMNH